MRTLIYEAMPDILRADVVLGIAAEYIERGHTVFLLLDEEVHLLSRNHIKQPHTISCLNVIRAKIAPSKIPCYVTPASAALNKRFRVQPGKATLAEIQSYKCKHYREILEAFRPDEIVIWNGLMDYQQGLIQLAKKYNPRQKFLFLEAGWFPQKGNYYQDLKGVNAASSIADSPPREATPEEAEEINRWKQVYRERHGNHTVCDKGYYFVPLQLETDTNITLFSPFQTMERFLCWILDNSDNGIPIIVRPHPLDGSRQLNLRKLSPRIKIDNNTSLQQLIAESKAVVGINSTVLLESLIYEKPTIALGKGIFQSSKAIYLQNTNSALPDVGNGELTSIYDQNSFLHQLKSRQRRLPLFNNFRPMRENKLSVKSTQYREIDQISSRMKICVKQFSKKIYTKLT